MKIVLAPALALVERLSLRFCFGCAAILFLVPGAVALSLLGGHGGASAGSVVALVASAGPALYFLCALYVSTRSDIGRLRDTIARIASGDLTARLEAKSGARATEAAQLASAVDRMGEGLIEIVNQVLASAESIRTGAREIAAGNANLSQRTEEQAAALEQTAASIGELAASVRQNDEHCRHAKAGSEDAERVVARATTGMNELSETMRRIGESSRRMVDIIGAIESIAFQTNILALNAAVEAARAGDQGRGFAVVASEVRSLAQRAAESAREVKALIGASTGNVGAGVSQVQAVALTMEELLKASRGMADSIAQIAAASAEQRTGVEEVDRATHQMESVTQQNAALVEQASAVALSFEGESQRLVDAVGAFKVDRSEDRERAVALIRRAVAHVQQIGVAKACRDFDDPAGGFLFGEFYVFAFDARGVRIAYGGNPAKTGEHAWDVRDADGRYIVRDMLRLGTVRGKGWYEYRWSNPVTRAVEPKSAYVERVGDIVLGCGIYRREASAASLAPALTPTTLEARKARSASRVARGASLITE
jgi:methyl-accepting chemotaxis protein